MREDTNKIITVRNIRPTNVISQYATIFCPLHTCSFVLGSIFSIPVLRITNKIDINTTIDNIQMEIKYTMNSLSDTVYILFEGVVR
jgi:hypothetical protein